MSLKSNKLYNYLVNTYGLSKEVVLSFAKDRVEDVLNKHMKAKLDSNAMENMILNRVAAILKDGFKDRYYYHNQDTFEEMVKNTIKEEIKKQLTENYTITVEKK